MHRFGYRSRKDSGFNDLFNINIFKESPSRDSPGVGGFVPYGTSGEPPSTTAVYLHSVVTDEDVAVAFTDIDGHFDIGYLHSGPEANFTVTIPDFDLVSSLKLTNNNGGKFIDFGSAESGRAEGPPLNKQSRTRLVHLPILRRWKRKANNNPPKD